MLLHEAEVALRMARSYFEKWRATGPDTTSPVALRHAYQTHEALFEASHAVAVLIETFRIEVSAELAMPRPPDLPVQLG